MKRHLIALLVLLSATTLNAQQGAPSAESRMRDALKKIMLQLRDSEAARATAQAAQLDAEAKNKELTTKTDDLTKKVATLIKDSIKAKDIADKLEADLNGKVASRDKEIAQLKEALGKWKDGYQKASDVANAKEKERADMAGKVIIMERKVADYERKNVAMYQAGSEILDRYQKFGLGTALLAREPFVGTMRVKFQNWMQDYGDKLEAQRIKPSEGGAVQAKTAPAKADKPKAGSENAAAPPSKS